MVLNDLCKFLRKADGNNKAGYLQRSSQDVWVCALPDSNYTLHFSIHVNQEDVERIQARNLEWIGKHASDFAYSEPPEPIKDTVQERVALVEEPNALAILDDTCVKCQERYLADVTPKIDLLIDGYYAQRIIEEYCPECDQPLIQRLTFHPPNQYEAEFHNENAPPEHQFNPEDIDIGTYTWKHARR